MADVNRGNRPLSPHLQVYNLPLSARLSILHRITGIGLGIGGVVAVWWFTALARGPERFASVDWLLTSWLGGLVMIGFAAELWYHFFTGVRHLWMDTGAGYDLETAHKSGIVVLIATGVMTVITLLVGWF